MIEIANRHATRVQAAFDRRHPPGISGEERPHALAEFASRPLSCTVKRATELSGLSRNLLYKYIGEGKLRSAVVGGRRLIFFDSLEALIQGGAGHA